MVPRVVLMKTGLKTVNNARPVNTVRSVNTARPFSTARDFNTVRPSYTAHPKSTVHCARPRTRFQNQAQSIIQRPFYKRTALTKRSHNQNVNTGKQTVNTGRKNVNTIRARGFNVVKPSACWVWKPIKPNGAINQSNSQVNDKGFVDSGCSRHMSGNTIFQILKTLMKDMLLLVEEQIEAELLAKKLFLLACYVHNRVLIVKPHNKTPYELFRGIKPAIGFMKPFGCHVSILNTLDKLGKFDGKSDEGIQEVFEFSTSSQQDQDWIAMPIWKDASDLVDASPNIIMVLADQQVNTSPSRAMKLIFGSREVRTSSPEVNIATPEIWRNFIIQNCKRTGCLVDLPKGIEPMGTHTIERGGNMYVNSTSFDDPDQNPIKSIRSTKKELCDEFEKLMKDKFQMSSMGDPHLLFCDVHVQAQESIFNISQDKYVHEILKKFNYSDVKSVSIPTDLEKPLVQDGDAADVDEHLYRSMIGFLMYLIASRPDIMFAVCACARFEVSLKTSHLLAVKRIFRYLKGKPSLGLWYSKDSPLELVAYTDTDYAGATQDRKSTTRGCQFLGNRLISWQCKKQTVVATSTTEAKYVPAYKVAC
ncbi:hypothetical protein Tco_0185989 [Tanacetum coccineum]